MEPRMGTKTKIALIGSLVMVAGITAMQNLGSELQDEFAAQAAVEPEVMAASSVPPSQSVEVAQPIESRRGETILEQAILDAFPTSKPKSADQRRKTAAAKAFVGVAINAQGYLCADPVEMRQAAPGQYGIGCVMNRNGTGAAIYLLDARNGSVTPIG